MWDHQKSIKLSRFGVLLFAALIFSGAVSAPWMVKYVISISHMPLEGKEIFFYLTLYGGCLPALLMLFDLYRVLQRIEGGDIFIPENVSRLRRISWCCFCGGGICLLAMLYYPPFGVVAFAAVFVGMIVRVVKNVMAEAVVLKEDADFTI